jgi:hypothetical protein
MIFTSNSVIFNDASQVRLEVYIPSALLDVSIPDSVWQSSIDNFNHRLQNRPTVTTNVNNVFMDIIKLESVEDSIDCLRIGSVVLMVLMKEEDIPKISDTHFLLTGHLTFAPKSSKVESMYIKNITYGGSESKTFKILNDADEDITRL